MFTLFPNLPQELREMIWKFALPGPRTIEISLVNPHRSPAYYFKVPAVLQVSREARKTVQGFYRLFLERKRKDGARFIAFQCHIILISKEMLFL
jgi:hypothetical protein